MGKTVRSTSKVCKDSFENQLLRAKKVIVSSKAEVFMRDFRISEYNVDTVFPNQFGETVEQYTEREIKNYQVVIEHLKEMIIVLDDPSSDRPIAGEFNWIFAALEHRTELDDDLFGTMSLQQKNTLLQTLIDESEIRLTMLQSIVPVSLVSSTTESKEIMTAQNNTSNNVNNSQEAIDKAAAAAIAAYKEVEARAAAYLFDMQKTAAAAAKSSKEADERAAINMAAYKAAEERAAAYLAAIDKATANAADQIAAAVKAEKAAEKVASDKTEAVDVEPKKVAAVVAKTDDKGTDWKKVGKYTAVTAVTVAAGAGAYWLYKNKMSGSGVSFGGSGEQIVGG